MYKQIQPPIKTAAWDPICIKQKVKRENLKIDVGGDRRNQRDIAEIRKKSTSDH